MSEDTVLFKRWLQLNTLVVLHSQLYSITGRKKKTSDHGISTTAIICFNICYW